MGRQPCCDKVGLKRGPWTIEEDHKLMNFILNNGIQCWRMVPKLAGLLRCGKSCRLRWINYLRPDLKRGGFTEMEENQIIQLHSQLGNRWSKIASHFPGRTDNEIKNHWNTRIKKTLKQLGIDPVTHKPIDNEDQQTKNTITNEPIPQESNNSSIGQVDQPKNELMSRPEERKSEKEDLALMDETSSHLNNNYSNKLFNSYEISSSGGMDYFGSWINQLESNNISSTSSLSSAEEYSNNNLFINESPNSVQEDHCSLQQWVDSVDSILSWESFTHLCDDVFFLENSNNI